ncbi:MAG: 2-oxoacid:acceptor oxidoreductase family protein [Candidatus Omnitrophica bacterium]|nr:2-oxoacid:acceptor oxidoreductase family protein [Candidatus Omnitrophota bacterium]MCM8799865.1 2-oxoacid:acceptor oxidoreductase family protein [Candidatus Omnitrophota bacterium]
MTEKIIISGAGGQGVMLLGRVIAEVALNENKFTSWLPSYGAEVRGGSAFCMVVVSDEEIPSPYIEKADTLIVFNKPSLEKFISWLKPEGLLLVNSSLVPKLNPNKNIQILSFPLTEIAVKLGNIKVANMVALGIYLKRKKLFDIKTVFKTIKKITLSDKKNLIDINIKAIKEGLNLI